MSREEIRITGKMVVLREKRLSDARNDYEWSCDPLLSRLDAASPLNMSYTEFLDEYTLDIDYSSSSRRRFAIETTDGEHIGNCSYYNIDYRRGEAEIGIMIGKPEYWGKGYGTDTLKTLINYIFKNTSFKRIYLKTLEWNKRAQKCFIKTGFSPYDKIRRNGYTFLLMELPRSKWELQSENQESYESNSRTTG